MPSLAGPIPLSFLSGLSCDYGGAPAPQINLVEHLAKQPRAFGRKIRDVERYHIFAAIIAYLNDDYVRRAGVFDGAQDSGEVANTHAGTRISCCATDDADTAVPVRYVPSSASRLGAESKRYPCVCMLSIGS